MQNILLLENGLVFFFFYSILVVCTSFGVVLFCFFFLSRSGGWKIARLLIITRITWFGCAWLASDFILI